MADQPSPSPARLLAPIALIACAIALILVVGASGLGGGDDGGGGGGGEDTTTPAATETSATTEEPEPPLRRNYVVKAGDNLDVIAEKTGVPVETLQELNPELDPQALVIGQKITLRE